MGQQLIFSPLLSFYMLIIHLNCFMWIDSSAAAQKAWAEWSSHNMLERWETHPFPAIYCKPFLQSAPNGAITRLRWKYLLLSPIYLNTGHIPSQQNAQCVAITVLLCVSSFPNNLLAAISRLQLSSQCFVNSLGEELMY